jgi:hypothetical protein
MINLSCLDRALCLLAGDKGFFVYSIHLNYLITKFHITANHYVVADPTPNFIIVIQHRNSCGLNNPSIGSEPMKLLANATVA